MGGQGRKPIIPHVSPKRYRECQGLPSVGEVALRSNDGEGKPGTKEPQAQRWAGSLSERYYRSVWDSPSASLPSQSGLRPPAPPEGEPLACRSGSPSYNLSVSLRSTAPLVGEPLAKRRSFPLCQGLPSVGEVARRRRDGEVELLSQRESLCLRALREFVENARVKREEFVNVIKMRRRY